MIRVTTKCPYCKAVISVNNTHYKSKGCPMKKCYSCGRFYIDKYCKEPAFNKFRKFTWINCLISSLLIPLIVVILLQEFLEYFFDSKALWITTPLFVISAIALFIYQFKDIENTNVVNFKEWKESEERLKDLNYIKMLVDAHYDVPRKYKVALKKSQTDQNYILSQYCPNCGVEIKGNNNFCGNCGARL